MTTYYDLLDWVNKKHRIPSEKSDDDTEKTLGIWCSNKRQSTKDNERIKMLEKIPHWYWDKHEDQFTTKYNELVLWINVKNRMPTEHGDDDERKLGKWCGNRRQDYKNGILSEQRIELLEKIFYWYWKKEDIYYINAKKIKRWMDLHKKVPLTTSKDDEEKALAKYRKKYLENYNKGKLNEIQIKKLKELKIIN
jgi:hypothetical protein